jgi:Reverse transcriptase (RNA-dependent DNA polymerase)
MSLGLFQLAICSMIFKEVIAYYVICDSNVHCVFLDSSKAFDKVKYCKLFNLLLGRQIPPHIIRVLLNMYTGQQVIVLWNEVYSHKFPVVNGVKQGAIISPILFLCLSRYFTLRTEESWTRLSHRTLIRCSFSLRRRRSAAGFDRSREPCILC